MKGKTDEKKINGVLYDTATASLIVESESMTVLPSKLFLEFFTADYVKNESLPMQNSREQTIIKSPDHSRSQNIKTGSQQ